MLPLRRSNRPHRLKMNLQPLGMVGTGDQARAAGSGSSFIVPSKSSLEDGGQGPLGVGNRIAPYPSCPSTRYLRVTIRLAGRRSARPGCGRQLAFHPPSSAPLRAAPCRRVPAKASWRPHPAPPVLMVSGRGASINAPRPSAEGFSFACGARRTRGAVEGRGFARCKSFLDFRPRQRCGFAVSGRQRSPDQLARLG